MDFELSGEQELLRDNVARLMKERYGFEARKAYQAAPQGWSEALWRDYAEMGLLGAPFAEADGGFGGGAVETMIVMEEFGKALALEPYLQTVVLCGALLKHGASAERRAELVGAIAAGESALELRACGKAIGLRSQRCGSERGQGRRRRLRVEGRKDARRPGRQRRSIYRLGAPQGRAPRSRGNWPLPRRRRRSWA